MVIRFYSVTLQPSSKFRLMVSINLAQSHNYAIRLTIVIFPASYQIAYNYSTSVACNRR